jgi:hypothetical protein
MILYIEMEECRWSEEALSQRKLLTVPDTILGQL